MQEDYRKRSTGIRNGFLILTVIVLAAAVIQPVSAHCPLCTAGAAAGVGIARAAGVDDAIVGLWLGAFIAASALWLDRLLKKRGIDYPLQGVLLVAASLLALVVPLYYAGIITDIEVVRSMPDYHAVLGMESLGFDRLFSGTIIGTVMIAAIFLANDALVAGKGKRYIPYQGMVLIAIALVITTILLRVTAN